MGKLFSQQYILHRYSLFMKNLIKIASSLVILSSSLLACNNNQNINLTLAEIQNQSKNNDMTQYQIYQEQSRAILENFPETKEMLLKWQADSQAGQDYKKALIKDLGKQNKEISSEDILKIMAEKPLNTNESFKAIDFLKDQGEHKSKITEWWYYNGHMNSEDGHKYGFELCFFRGSPIVYFVHVAVTDENNQKFSYIRKFHSPLKVKTDKNRGNLTYGNQTARQTGEFNFDIHGETGKYKFDLSLELEKGPMLINGNGLIDMPEGKDSYYYSLTRMKAKGSISDNGKISPVTGQAWFDHQWGNFIAMRVGWDWFSFQMDDNTEYNLFSFRNKKDQTLKQFANVFDQNSKTNSSQGLKIRRLEWWQSPDTSDLYVRKWEVQIPQRQESFIVEAAVPGQEVFPVLKYDIAPTYWEGSSKVTKIMPDGRKINGLAYVEHMPYRSKIN